MAPLGVVVLLFAVGVATAYPGMFGADQTVVAGGAVVVPYCVRVADLDNDGFVDVLSASDSDGKIAFYRNMFDGRTVSWGPQQVLGITGAYDLNVADLDGDRRKDVVACGHSKASYFINSSEAPFHQFPLSGFDNCRTIDAFDLDGDGDLDLVMGAHNLYVFENLRTTTPGTASFGPATLIARGSDDVIDYHHATAADLDLDGLPDLIYSVGDANIYWYWNRGNLTFGAQTLACASNDRKVPFVAVDFDWDLDVDIIFVDGGAVWFCENLYAQNGGHVAFAAAVAVFRGVSGHNPAVGDVNNDGMLDVVMGTMWLERAAGAPPQFASAHFVSDRDVFQVGLADFDHDGDMDITSAVPTPYDEAAVIWNENRLLN